MESMLPSIAAAVVSTECKPTAGAHCLCAPCSLASAQTLGKNNLRCAGSEVGHGNNGKALLPCTMLNTGKTHAFYLDLSYVLFRLLAAYFTDQKKEVILLIKTTHTSHISECGADNEGRYFNGIVSLFHYFSFVILSIYICFMHTTCQESKPLDVLLTFHPRC